MRSPPFAPATSSSSRPTRSTGSAPIRPTRASGRRLAQLKGRPETQPIALLAAEFETILDAVPELRGRVAARRRGTAPGPLHTRLAEPWAAFPVALRNEPGGDRHPRSGASSSRPRRGRPRRARWRRRAPTATARPTRRGSRTFPEEIRAQALVVDAGELPGTPSTVLDLTGPVPLVLREGAVPAAEALARLSGLAAAEL